MCGSPSRSPLSVSGICRLPSVPSSRTPRIGGVTSPFGCDRRAAVGAVMALHHPDAGQAWSRRDDSSGSPPRRRAPHTRRPPAPSPTCRGPARARRPTRATGRPAGPWRRCRRPEPDRPPAAAHPRESGRPTATSNSTPSAGLSRQRRRQRAANEPHTGLRHTPSRSPTIVPRVLRCRAFPTAWRRRCTVPNGSLLR